ncbi:hypothetical protein Q8F55_008884 [Vanrija albida]|uniref:SCP domain-containing protein n=1 Tax=Vanrija albida TaxID=181172 RepID=A0ABR3PT05_9TREE
MKLALLVSALAALAAPAAAQAPDPSAVRLTTDSTAEDVAGTSAASQSILSYHNNLRGQWSAPPVIWDAELAQAAKDATAQCQFGGNDGGKLGWVTWYWAGSWGRRPRFNALDASQYWARTADQHKNGGGNNFDSFAIGVWKNQEAIGCAWKRDCQRGGWQGNSMTWLCLYDNQWDGTDANAKENVGPYKG